MTATRNPAAMLLALVLLAAVYGSMHLTHDARTHHAGEQWQAADIADYFDGLIQCGQSDRIQTRHLESGLDAVWCQVNQGKAVGLIVALAAGVIVTGFMARIDYWRRNCR